jgi:threonine dehydrogenase-like Zn-dependent dehydrogenase
MSVQEVDEPVCPPGRVRIAVEVVGLCGSDYHLFSGEHPYAHFPQTQGHEFSGRVVEIGPGYVSPVTVGERVVVEPFVECGTCVACRAGRSNCCRTLQVMGGHISGALAEQVIVPVEHVYRAGTLAADVAALVEPISIGMQAVRRGQVLGKDRVVVLGAGPVGLAAALSAADVGARVLVVDRVASRLENARNLGAERVVDNSRMDVRAAVAEWTAGDGADVVVEATGVPALVRESFELAAPSGRIVIVGISGAEVSIPVIEFSRKELSVYGSRNSVGLFPDAIDLVERNAVRLAPLITHRFELDQVGEAIAFALSNPDQVEKVVIEIGGIR